MSDKGTYSVILSGSIKSGFKPEQVVRAFAQLFKLPPQRAAGIVGRRMVLKRDLKPQQAKQYAVQLSRIGIEVVVKREADDKSSRQNPTPAVDSAKTVARKYFPLRINYLADFLRARFKYLTDFIPLRFKHLALPVIAAILGAIIWYLIAAKLDFEPSLVAWFIGGGVGLAAKVSGRSNVSVGAICALLVLLAVFGGKYAATIEHRAEVQAFLESTDAHQAADFRSVYEEEMKDARAFARISSNPDSLKQFMATRGYSEFISADNVTDSELDDFNKNTAPHLLNLARQNPTFQAWQADALSDSAADVSALGLVIGGFGWLNLLFLLLGMGTAFHMASGGTMSLSQLFPERLGLLAAGNSVRVKTAINSIFTKLKR